jgi:hypothetical protein
MSKIKKKIANWTKPITKQNRKLKEMNILDGFAIIVLAAVEELTNEMKCNSPGKKIDSPTKIEENKRENEFCDEEQGEIKKQKTRAKPRYFCHKCCTPLGGPNSKCKDCSGSCQFGSDCPNVKVHGKQEEKKISVTQQKKEEKARNKGRLDRFDMLWGSKKMASNPIAMNQWVKEQKEQNPDKSEVEIRRDWWVSFQKAKEEQETLDKHKKEVIKAMESEDIAFEDLEGFVEGKKKEILEKKDNKENK